MSGYPPTTILASDIPTYTFVNTSDSLRVIKLPAASTVPGKLLCITNSAHGNFSTFTIPSSLYISTTGVDRFENQFHTSSFFTILSTVNTTLQVASDGQSNWMVVGLSQSSTSAISLNPFIRSSFAPDQIPNLRIWLDASDPGTIIPSTNSQVQRWLSKAPAAGPRPNVIQTTGAQSGSGATPGSRPALTGINTINGRNALFFSTTCEMFFSTTFTGGPTVFSVIRPLVGPDPTFPSTMLLGNSVAPTLADTTYNLIFLYNSNIPAFPYSIQTRTNTTVVGTTRPPLTAAIFSNSPFLSTFLLCCINGVPASNVITVNGYNQPLNSSITNVLNINTTNQNYIISRHRFSTTFDLGELLVYANTLGTADRQNVEGYLAWKWQLYENLPPSHPYRFHSPTFNF
jgi:hypothetical protein